MIWCGRCFRGGCMGVRRRLQALGSKIQQGVDVKLRRLSSAHRRQRKVGWPGIHSRNTFTGGTRLACRCCGLQKLHESACQPQLLRDSAVSLPSLEMRFISRNPGEGRNVFLLRKE